MADEISTLALKLDSRDFESGLARCAAGTENLGNISVKTIAAIASAWGSSKVAGIFKTAISAASSAREDLAQFRHVMRNVTKDSEAMLESLTSSDYGRTAKQAQQMLMSITSLAKGMGVADSEALNLAGSFSKLSVDIGSFMAKDPSDVMHAFESALMGNTMALRSYGVFLNEETIKTELAIQAKKGLTFASEREAKAYAILAAAQKQQADAIGDYAVESLAYSNQIKQVGAKIEEIVEKFGKGLLEPATAAVTGLNKLLDVIRGVDEGTMKFISRTTALGVGIVGVTGTVYALVTAWKIKNAILATGAAATAKNTVATQADTAATGVLTKSTGVLAAATGVSAKAINVETAALVKNTAAKKANAVQRQFDFNRSLFPTFDASSKGLHAVAAPKVRDPVAYAMEDIARQQAAGKVASGVARKAATGAAASSVGFWSTKTPGLTALGAKGGAIGSTAAAAAPIVAVATMITGTFLTIKDAVEGTKVPFDNFGMNLETAADATNVLTLGAYKAGEAFWKWTGATDAMTSWIGKTFLGMSDIEAKSKRLDAELAASNAKLQEAIERNTKILETIANGKGAYKDFLVEANANKKQYEYDRMSPENKLAELNKREMELKSQRMGETGTNWIEELDKKIATTEKFFEEHWKTVSGAIRPPKREMDQLESLYRQRDNLKAMISGNGPDWHKNFMRDSGQRIDFAKEKRDKAEQEYGVYSRQFKEADQALQRLITMQAEVIAKMPELDKAWYKIQNERDPIEKLVANQKWGLYQSANDAIFSHEMSQIKTNPEKLDRIVEKFDEYLGYAKNALDKGDEKQAMEWAQKGYDLAEQNKHIEEMTLPPESRTTSGTQAAVERNSIAARELENRMFAELQKQELVEAKKLNAKQDKAVEYLKIIAGKNQNATQPIEVVTE